MAAFFVIFLEGICGRTYRPQAKSEYPTGGILQNQLGLVSDKGILCNGTGPRAIQVHNIVFEADCAAYAGLNIPQAKPVTAYFKNFAGTAIPTSIQ